MKSNVPADVMYTDEEREAVSFYRADSIYVHAHMQGWNASELSADGYATFERRAQKEILNLDSAIKKSAIESDAILFSGHRWATLFGALRNSPDRFVGLNYQYPGYISTSSVKGIAADFAIKSAGTGSQPVVLRLHLPSGYPALDMHRIDGGNHEQEFLVGRNAKFRIEKVERSEWRQREITWFGLEPTT